MDKFIDNQEGIFLGLPHQVYRKASGVNFSSLKYMAESPRKYLWALQNPKEQTAAMIFGSIVHALLLEPDTVSSLVVTRPPQWDSWRTNAAKEWRDQQTALVATDEEFAQIQAAAEAVKTDPKAAWILQRAEKEVGIFRKHEATGFLLKGRLDLPFIDLNGNTAVCDIKKVQSVKRGLFSKAVGDRLMHAQLAFYLDLIGANGGGYILAVEEEEPHETRLFKFTDASIARGRAMYEAWLTKLAWCIKNDRYPGIDEDSAEVAEIEEPIWIQREELPY
jgi:hypothetical protein